MQVSIPQAVRAVATDNEIYVINKKTLRFNTASGTRCCNYIILTGKESSLFWEVSIPQAVRAVATLIESQGYDINIDSLFQYRKRYALLQPVTTNLNVLSNILVSIPQAVRAVATFQDHPPLDTNYVSFNTASGTRCCNCLYSIL